MRIKCKKALNHFKLHINTLHNLPQFLMTRFHKIKSSDFVKVACSQLRKIRRRKPVLGTMIPEDTLFL